MGEAISAVFSPELFLEDAQTLAAAVGSAFSETTTRTVLKTYEENFKHGAVLWRLTDRPGHALDYRFYERRPTDTIGKAVDAGFISSDNPLVRLISAWSALYNGSPEQSCDFSTKSGLTKTWVWLAGIRPIDDIFNTVGVPPEIRRHRDTFKELGLSRIRNLAVDYRSETVNIYFRAPGPSSEEQVRRYVKTLVDHELESTDVDEIRQHLSPEGFTFAVTLKHATGEIGRVGFYALKLAPGKFPQLNARLSTFFKTAPSYDSEEMNAVAWSYGPDGGKYTKAERSYTGELIPLLRRCDTTFSS